MSARTAATRGALPRASTHRGASTRPSGKRPAQSATVPAGTLDAGIDALGLRLDAAQRARLAEYLALLAKWNAHYNLTAIRDPGQMVTHHALDALAVVPHLPAAASPRPPVSVADSAAPQAGGGTFAAARLRLLDVGTGGGIPGIPIAIARPDLEVTMLDANSKKTAFVQQAIIELALPNAQVVTSRVEEWHEANVDFDVVISRAYSDLSSFAQGAMSHLAPRGRLYAMKGVVPRDEIAALPSMLRVAEIVTLDVPGLGAARSLVIMERA